MNSPNPMLHRWFPIIAFLLALCRHDLLCQDTLGGVISTVNTTSNGVVVYANDTLNRGALDDLVDDKALDGWSLSVVGFDGTQENMLRAQIELSWDASKSWAFYYQGRVFASGIQMPSGPDIVGACRNAGIPNRIALLKDFLAAQPANLDARQELLKELRRMAHQKTARRMNIQPNDHRDVSRYLGSTLPSETHTELPADIDKNIWGDFASFCVVAFNSGQWLSVLPDAYNGRIQDCNAIYSPTMKAVYKKNIAKVEDALRDNPLDSALWSLWQELARASGRKCRDFFQQLTPLPAEGNYTWPPVRVLDWMRLEATHASDWSTVVELLLPAWPGIQSSMDVFAPVGNVPRQNSESLGMQKEILWDSQILPLYDACLKIKDYGHAFEIYSDLASRPLFEREANIAFNMAKHSNYTFPEPFASKREIPKLQSFIGDPVVGDVVVNKPIYNQLTDFQHAKGRLFLLVVDPSFNDPNAAQQPSADTTDASDQADITGEGESEGEVKATGNYTTPPLPQTESQAPYVDPVESLKQHIQFLLNQDDLVEYHISIHDIIKPHHPIYRELLDREKLPDNTFFWGIIDDTSTYYHGGYAPPTVDSVNQLLGSMNIKSKLRQFRDFSKANPDLVPAKLILMTELERIGVIRASNRSLNPEKYLDTNEDQEIWGEYVGIAKPIVLHFIQHPYDAIMFRQYPAASRSSRLLQQFAVKSVSAIESALTQRPHSRLLWKLWGLFSPHVPNKSLSSFLTTLSPVPDLSGFPPAFLYPELINSYQSMDSWVAIIELIEPIWTPIQEMLDGGENARHRLTKELYAQYIAPLCDAYRKIGQDWKAEKVLSYWSNAQELSLNSATMSLGRGWPGG